MTIQKKDMSFESYEKLTVNDFKDKETMKVKIHEKPRTVKTPFADDQPLIIVEFGIEKRAWWSNWTSLNALIDKFGTDEGLMVGKEIELELVRQPVSGKMRKVIYLKGALDSEDEG